MVNSFLFIAIIVAYAHFSVKNEMNWTWCYSKVIATEKEKLPFGSMFFLSIFTFHNINSALADRDEGAVARDLVRDGNEKGRDRARDHRRS